MESMRAHAQTLRTTLFVAGLALATASASACVEADVADLDSGVAATRTSTEAQRAEEIEALLPGVWMWEDGSADALDLSIVFLGHDAVTGDVALLIEGESDDAVVPASVQLQGPVATLVVDTAQAWRITALRDDSLVLVAVGSGATARFHRMP